MQFKILSDAKDAELRAMDRANERLEEQCKALMEELEESTKYQESQKRNIEGLALYDQFMDRLHRQQTQCQSPSENEHNLSRRVVERLHSDWTIIAKVGEDVDLDDKVASTNRFFNRMDGVDIDLSNQLHVIRKRLKAKEVHNSEEVGL